MKFKILMGFILCWGYICNAQTLTPSVVASSGNLGFNEGVSLGWTVGQPVIETISNPILTLTQGFQQGGSNGKQISGLFRYNNTQLTALDSVKIVLTINGNRLDSVYTNTSGYFQFSGVVPGNYRLTAYSGKPWLGVNATDAIKIQRHFAGMELLTVPIRLLAADVNNSNSINATDGIKVKRRFSGIDNSFLRGDWTFSKTTGGDTIVMSNSNVSQDFQGLCVGDVNGSNVPAPGDYIQNHVVIVSEGSIDVMPGQEFNVPLNATQDMSVSAISLVIPISQDYLQVESVEVKSGSPVFSILNGQLRIAWSELDPIILKAGQPLITVKLRATEQFTTTQLINLQATSESEIADEYGEGISLVTLSSYTISMLNLTGLNPSTSLVSSVNVFPNPAKDMVKLSLQLSQPAIAEIRMMDELGNLVHVLGQHALKTGNNEISINLQNRCSGIYYFRIDLAIKDQTIQFVKKFVILQ
ncbi:MAG: T9SS type A sorting domain-containing protein [Bacteroidetes bacterium]|nr:T9SS type A sorting domain-containing protein [Bacteroidota bacterium]